MKYSFNCKLIIRITKNEDEIGKIKDLCKINILSLLINRRTLNILTYLYALVIILQILDKHNLFCLIYRVSKHTA